MMNAINENKKQVKGRESDQPPTDEDVKNTSPQQATPKFVHEFNMNSECTLISKLHMAGYQSNSMNDVYNDIDGYNENNDVLEKTDINVHEARDNTKPVDESIDEVQISESQFTFSDEVLRSIDLDFIKKSMLKLKMSSRTKRVSLRLM
ncbi:hypothetical protein P3S67_023970 [Capsicum chacoense]